MGSRTNRNAGILVEATLMTKDPEQLVTLTTATSEFSAHLTIAVLEEAGIEAFAFGSTSTTFGLAGQVMNPYEWGVPVQVRRGELEAARAALNANRRDSIDIDWDMVDVGGPVEPVFASGHAPALASIGWVIAAALILVGLLAAVAVFFSP